MWQECTVLIVYIVSSYYIHICLTDTSMYSQEEVLYLLSPVCIASFRTVIFGPVLFHLYTWWPHYISYSSTTNILFSLQSCISNYISDISVEMHHHYCTVHITTVALIIFSPKPSFSLSLIYWYLHHPTYWNGRVFGFSVSLLSILFISPIFNLSPNHVVFFFTVLEKHNFSIIPGKALVHNLFFNCLDYGNLFSGCLSSHIFQCPTAFLVTLTMWQLTLNHNLPLGYCAGFISLPSLIMALPQSSQTTLSS